MGAVSSLAIASSSYGAGVSVGSSVLFDTPDYSDTFTGTDAGGAPNRPFIPAVQPAPAYVVENTHGNPPISFQIGSGFSFAADGPGTPGFVNGVPAYPLGAAPNASGAGSDTGFTQTGGAVDYGIAYGLRDVYTVQVDAVQTTDRIDLSSGAGLGIFAPDSLSVFFRGDGSGNASLFNGTVDTSIQSIIPGFNTGITGAGQWHNYAATYNQVNKTIELFVDQDSKGVIDLTTFSGGIYQNFSNATVGAGGAGGNRVWTDNFQVGGNGAIPPPPAPQDLSMFHDQFERPNGPVDGWTTHKGQWNIDNGRLVIGPTNEETMIFAGVPAGELPQDYSMEFTWEYLSEGSNPAIGKHAGAVFNWNTSADRFNGASNGYNLFWIDRATDFGLTLARFDGAAITVLNPPGGTGATLPEPPDHIKISVLGDVIRVFADGQLIIDVVDDTYRGGRAGLWTWTGGQVVAFDNVWIMVPEPTTLSALALGVAGFLGRRRYAR